MSARFLCFLGGKIWSAEACYSRFVMSYVSCDSKSKSPQQNDLPRRNLSAGLKAHQIDSRRLI